MIKENWESVDGMEASIGKERERSEEMSKHVKMMC